MRIIIEMIVKRCIKQTAESLFHRRNYHSISIYSRQTSVGNECASLLLQHKQHDVMTISTSNPRPFSSTHTESKFESKSESMRTTHFGFEEVPVDEKQDRVLGVFENVAENYDVMNDLMSGGLHRLWKDELLNMTGVAPMAAALRRANNTNRHQSSSGKILSILDVAGGTGDVAFRFLEAARCPERALSSGQDEIAITVCDINPHMLNVGQRRARKRYGDAVLDTARSLSFVEGNAQDLVNFDESSFDIYTIAFGLRNVTDVDRALEEAYRVLKPGGRYMCLEFSKVHHPALAKLYDAYSFNIIPTVGDLVAGDRDSYRYLVESIRKFSDQEELKKKMENAGFIGCKYTNMTGGIVAIHEGWKPLE